VNYSNDMAKFLNEKKLTSSGGSREAGLGGGEGGRRLDDSGSRGAVAV
jgi:hypothetical protein